VRRAFDSLPSLIAPLQPVVAALPSIIASVLTDFAPLQTDFASVRRHFASVQTVPEGDRRRSPFQTTAFPAQWCLFQRDKPPSSRQGIVSTPCEVRSEACEHAPYPCDDTLEGRDDRSDPCEVASHACDDAPLAARCVSDAQRCPLQARDEAAPAPRWLSHARDEVPVNPAMGHGRR
jgi:hypothetical protein